MKPTTKPKSPCRWKRCDASASKLILGVPLCEEHFSEALALERERDWTEFVKLLAKKVTAESARDLEGQAARYEDAAVAAPDVVKTAAKPGAGA